MPLDYGERVQRKQVVVVAIGDDVRIDAREIATGRPLAAIDGTLEELERRAALGGLDDHLLKARIRSEDPIPDLAERLLAASPRCVVFDLHNAAAEPGAEPSLTEQFREWRASAALGVTAPDELVTELLGAALAGAGEPTAPDLGVDHLHARAGQVLAALGVAAPGD